MARNVAAITRENMREQLWPGSVNEIYDRKRVSGFTTIPRTLSLILTLIEQLGDKGKNASRVYAELWCRSFDEHLIDIADEEAFAFAAGLGSVRRWRERVDILSKLGFIRIAPRGGKKYGYILLRDPHKVIKELRASRADVSPNWWGAYVKRAGEIGYTLP